MGSRRSKRKAPTPPPIQETPSILSDIDRSSMASYQQAASADDMTLESTRLTKPKRKKQTGDDTTLMGMY
tara:strand:+ start:1349 stop:1558 length:210 start_codon:yes stop_codon:yes gene_type:complete